MGLSDAARTRTTASSLPAVGSAKSSNRGAFPSSYSTAAFILPPPDLCPCIMPSVRPAARSKRRSLAAHLHLAFFSNLLRQKVILAPRILFVEKIFASHLIEGAERIRPAGDDFFGRHAVFDLLNRVGIAQEPHKFVPVKFLRIKLLENLGNFQAQAHGPRRETIRNPNPYPAATLAAMRAANRDEGLRRKMQTGKVALV